MYDWEILENLKGKSKDDNGSAQDHRDHLFAGEDQHNDGKTSECSGCLPSSRRDGGARHKWRAQETQETHKSESRRKDDEKEVEKPRCRSDRTRP